MKVTFLALAALACSFQVLAQTPSLSEESFCADRVDKNFIKDLTMDSSNLMPFRNHGGIANGGVCWWHSRFQRNALYLTIYKPELARPTQDEARELIKKIRSATEVVVIPGYSNFSEFADNNKALIQRELEKWQKGDGILRFAWVKGLSGAAEVTPDKMKGLMDQIYEEVEVNKNIAYNKLQIPGIVAHAWLVVHMEKVSGGYNLEIIDSNFARTTEIYRYHEGDTSINYHGYFHFTPYLEQTNEMKKINKTILKKCDPEAYQAGAKKEKETKDANSNNDTEG
ncbi:MAG: hypothetical protein PHY93_15850 [Bacteriovorax sp.]|nr:hypothetical protein [Bacteriovorax sp.]